MRGEGGGRKIEKTRVIKELIDSRPENDTFVPRRQDALETGKYVCSWFF